MGTEDYKKYWTRPNDSLLSEILDRTIDLDYMIIDIIKNYFDLRPKFNENNEITNRVKIANFSDFFFLEIGSYKN